MFENGHLNRLARRKEELLQQSAANRRTLSAQAQSLRPMAAWVDLGITISRKARTGWDAISPFFALWKSGRQESTGTIGKIASAVSFARSLASLWTNRR